MSIHTPKNRSELAEGREAWHGPSANTEIRNRQQGFREKLSKLMHIESQGQLDEERAAHHFCKLYLRENVGASETIMSMGDLSIEFRM